MNEMLKQHKPLLVCEILDFHDDSVATETQLRANKLVGIMQDYGYEMYKIKTDGLSIAFDKRDKVELIKWSEAKSINANDYLFIHPSDSRIGIVNS